MSKYATIGNRIMEVLEAFPGLDALASEDVDIAFFAKMDLTGALLKAVAGIKNDPMPIAKGTRYFKSTETSSLWAASNDGTIYHREEPGSEWFDVAEAWESANELVKCADVVEIDLTAFLLKAAGDLPPTVPPF